MSDNLPTYVVSWKNIFNRIQSAHCDSADGVQECLRTVHGELSDWARPLDRVGVYRLLGRSDQWLNSQKLH